MDYAVRNEKTWRQSLISFGGYQYRSVLFRCWANTYIRCSIDTNGSNLGRAAVGSQKENIGSFISRYRRQPAQSVCLSRRMVRRDLLGSETIYSVWLKCLILLTQFFPRSLWFLLPRGYKSYSVFSFQAGFWVNC